MAELIDIRRVLIGPENMTAEVRIADDAPLMTSEDIEGTARVYRLLPHIVEHVCLGDAGETFRDAMGDTELAHLLEHVTGELLAQTDMAGDMPAGRTWVDEIDHRTFRIELSCPDDVLVPAALSCGVWVLDWAYTGGGDPEPDIDAIVKGLVRMVKELGDEGEDLVIDYGPEEFDEQDAEEPPADESEEFDEGEPVAEQADGEPFAEPVLEPEPAAASEPAPEPAPAPAPERPLWTPAPEIPQRTRRPKEEVRVPEVEAEIDQIMATFSTAPAQRPTVFAEAELPELPVLDERDRAVTHTEDPVFEPQPDEPVREPQVEQIPNPRPVR